MVAILVPQMISHRRRSYRRQIHRISYAAGVVARDGGAVLASAGKLKHLRVRTSAHYAVIIGVAGRDPKVPMARRPGLEAELASEKCHEMPYLRST